MGEFLGFRELRPGETLFGGKGSLIPLTFTTLIRCPWGRSDHGRSTSENTEQENSKQSANQMANRSLR